VDGPGLYPQFQAGEVQERLQDDLLPSNGHERGSRAIVFQALFRPQRRPRELGLQAAGFGKIDWFGGTGAFVKITVIVMFAWSGRGAHGDLSGGHAGISADLYEAAVIDGANHRQLFLPHHRSALKPHPLFTVQQSTIGTMNLFTEPFVMTNNLKGRHR
jgi:ABC-type sugar transport system permease subunit